MLGSTRESIASAHSIVVKIGSSALTSLVAGLDTHRLDLLADAIEARMRAGSDVVVVSSGAVGAGLAPLGLTKRPRDLATKQAAASVGQLALAHAWGTSFARYGRTVGQVLLTADDIARRTQHRNAQRTLDRLRALHAVAIVNENDTVATTELRFGDNDRLAALVAHLVGADALILLSDVDGLYDGDPRKGDATLIPEVTVPRISTVWLPVRVAPSVPEAWRRSSQQHAWPLIPACRFCSRQHRTLRRHSVVPMSERHLRRGRRDCRPADSGFVTPLTHRVTSTSTKAPSARSCPSVEAFCPLASSVYPVTSTPAT